MILRPISKEQARKNRYMSADVRTAGERAIIVLRMLLGCECWDDGDERALDNCFEMGDGDEVVHCLMRMAKNDPQIHHLLSTHRNIGETCLNFWAERFPDPQLELF